MSDPSMKDMKIKTGVVKRLSKEKKCYEKEVEDMIVKISKMKKDNVDPYVIKKQEECLQESRAMVPDCGRRLQSAISDLTGVLDSNSYLEETQEFSDASQILKAAQE